jgi:hypothetical protein
MISDAVKSVSGKVWLGLLALFGLIVLIFKSKEVSKLEAEKQTAEAAKTDAVLAQKGADVQAEIVQVQQQAEAEKKKTLTPEELAKELDKI